MISIFRFCQNILLESQANLSKKKKQTSAGHSVETHLLRGVSWTQQITSAGLTASAP